MINKMIENNEMVIFMCESCSLVRIYFLFIDVRSIKKKKVSRKKSKITQLSLGDCLILVHFLCDPIIFGVWAKALVVVFRIHLVGL